MASSLFSNPKVFVPIIVAVIGLIGAIGAALIIRGRKRREEPDKPTPEEIAAKVAQLLATTSKEEPIPLPLLPYFYHAYPLREHFTGRVQERQMLTQWLTEDDKPVLVLEAIGGMGKSSLVWVWTCGDIIGLSAPGMPGNPNPVQSAMRVPDEHQPEGLLYWSFYEGGGTFHGFLETAINYFSGGAKTRDDYVTVVGQEERTVDHAAIQADLFQLLQQRRFLLVWDGAERLLREYGAIDAEYREERDAEELDPDARDIIEPAVARFLTDMAGQASSRLLLTSRLYPRVLEGLAGAEKKELTGLGEDYAEAYLRARGIRGNRSDLISAARQYDFHPLSLSNLAAYLIEDDDEEGDISAAPKYDATKKPRERRNHILARAYDRRAPHRQELVSRMAAVRGAIPKDVVRLLAEDIEGIQIEALRRDLNELVRHGLLRHPSPKIYDFHPVVRRYCYQRLEEKQETHRKLMDYFKTVPVPDEVKTLEDLTPVIELYHHTVGAGRYDEACELFRDRIASLLYFRFGAYQTRIELLRALFPEGEDKLPRLTKESDQAWTLNALAISYSLSGQSRRSVPLFEASNEIDDRRGNEIGVAIGLGNLASMAQIYLGELAAAEENQRRSIQLCCEIENEFREAIGHQWLGQLLAYKSAFDEAAQELNAAMTAFDGLDHKQAGGVTWAYRAMRALLMGDANAALEAARRARELADVQRVERDIIQAELDLGAAMIALATEEIEKQDEHLREAEGHLTEALTRCRRINLVELEPDILLAWARWNHAKGNPQQARDHAEEALSIAERCEYRLKQADIHNFIAQLALDAGDREAAIEHAQHARERAECDGEPHWYKPALDEAERMLKEAEEM